MAYIYKAVQSLKKAWSAVNGEEMLKKRNLSIDTDMKGMAQLGGFFAGGAAAMFYGYDAAGTVGAIGCVATGLLVVPIAVQLPISCYRAGEHDERVRKLTDQRAKQQQLPKPENPLI